MTNVTVLNDLHLGVQRCAGTTPVSAQALRDWLMQSYADTLAALPEDETLLLNGDVFDGYAVPLSVVGQFVQTTADWLRGTRRYVVMSRGNHDISRDSTNLSSFDFAGQVLKLLAPAQVTVVTAPQAFDFGYVVPHAANQDIFNAWLGEVPAGCCVFLHANFSSGFAARSDHSLDLSFEQASELIEQHGCSLVFAHEHQARAAFGDRLIITGNQWPSSIADCLNNPGNKKHHLRIAAGGHTLRRTWDGTEDFAEIPWHDLASSNTSARFIRVTGEATAAEAADMVNTIARYRRDSQAFVISNAVSVEGRKLEDGAEATVEALKTFNPLDLVLELLEPKQAAKIRKLLEN